MLWFISPLPSEHHSDFSSSYRLARSWSTDWQPAKVLDKKKNSSTEYIDGIEMIVMIGFQTLMYNPVREGHGHTPHNWNAIVIKNGKEHLWIPNLCTSHFNKL